MYDGLMHELKKDGNHESEDKWVERSDGVGWDLRRLRSNEDAVVRGEGAEEDDVD